MATFATHPLTCLDCGSTLQVQTTLSNHRRLAKTGWCCADCCDKRIAAMKEPYVVRHPRTDDAELSKFRAAVGSVWLSSAAGTEDNHEEMTG